MRPPLNPITDPFGERSARPHRRSLQLLGALFRFESNSARLLQLVDHAFAGLPRHRLGRNTPRLRVWLQLTAGQRDRSAAEPALLNTFAGPGLLCGAIDQSNLAVISPAHGSALVVVSHDMLLRHPYHVRYELIEFAVYVLAARAMGLVPLHAAAVGRHGRGVLLIGNSGAGKSTLALHCLLHGLEIVSEDGLFVTPRGLLTTGIASFLHLQRRGLRFLPGPDIAQRIRSSPIIRRRSGAQKYEVDLRRLGYRLAPAPLRIEAVVFLSARRASDRRLLVSVPARERAARLTAHQPYAASQQGWQRFAKSLAGVRAFELRRGSHPRVAVEALRELLDRPRRAAPSA
jgi:hypothetical protein